MFENDPVNNNKYVNITAITMLDTLIGCGFALKKNPILRIKENIIFLATSLELPKKVAKEREEKLNEKIIL